MWITPVRTMYIQCTYKKRGAHKCTAPLPFPCRITSPTALTSKGHNANDYHSPDECGDDNKGKHSKRVHGV